ASRDLVLEQPVADRADLLLVAPAPSAERHLEELLEVLAAVDPARRAEQRLGELDGPDLEVADAVAVERRRREGVDDRAVVVEERGDLRPLRCGRDRVEQLIQRRHRAPPRVAWHRSARSAPADRGT